MNQIIAAALKEAVSRYVNQDATPDVCNRIKREFVQIMRVKHAINWNRYSRQIRVEFINGSQPNLIIQPALLKRTLH